MRDCILEATTQYILLMVQISQTTSRDVQSPVNSRINYLTIYINWLAGFLNHQQYHTFMKTELVSYLNWRLFLMVYQWCRLLGGSSQDLDTCLRTMVISKSPKDRVVCSPSKWPNYMAHENGGGDPNHLYKSWDDAPSIICNTNIVFRPARSWAKSWQRWRVLSVQVAGTGTVSKRHPAVLPKRAVLLCRYVNGVRRQ